MTAMLIAYEILKELKSLWPTKKSLERSSVRFLNKS
jgi:hypothetical protein